MRIIALRGVPAAGKTTWAREHVDAKTTVRVNKDDIRRMLCPADNSKGYEWNPALEALVCAVHDGAIMAALEASYDVIVDNTHINPGHLERLEEIEQYADGLYGDVTLEVEDFEISVMEAIERDSLRSYSVGSQLIESMYVELEKTRNEV